MTDDNEGRWQRRTFVILADEFVALVLPVDVSVLLHCGEGIAGKQNKTV